MNSNLSSSWHIDCRHGPSGRNILMGRAETQKLNLTFNLFCGIFDISQYGVVYPYIFTLTYPIAACWWHMSLGDCWDSKRLVAPLTQENSLHCIGIELQDRDCIASHQAFCSGSGCSTPQLLNSETAAWSGVLLRFHLFKLDGWLVLPALHR